MSDLVTFGETMGLLTSPITGHLRHATSLQLGIAGAESNVAIGVRRLGRTATWIGRVGDDEVGRLVQARVRGEDVTVHAVVDPDASTALMLKEHRSFGTSRVVYYRSGSAGSKLAPEDLDEAAIAAAKVLHVTGITMALSSSARATVWAAVEIAAAAGTTVCLDYNYRAALWDREDAGRRLRDLTRSANVVFAGEQEAQLVDRADSPSELARSLAALGPQEAVIKRGPRGAVAVIDDELLEVPPVEVEVVDPVGAGDAFVAGYLAARSDDVSASARLRDAVLCQAFVVTVHGDWEGMPERSGLAEIHLGTSVQR